jgi:hypothetical protein
MREDGAATAERFLNFEHWWGLPRLSPEQMRVIRGQQELICRNQPEPALDPLPVLLSDPSDRENSSLF